MGRKTRNVLAVQSPSLDVCSQIQGASKASARSLWVLKRALPTFVAPTICHEVAAYWLSLSTALLRDCLKAAIAAFASPCSLYSSSSSWALADSAVSMR